MGGNGPAAVAAARGIVLEPEAGNLENRQSQKRWWDEKSGEYRPERRRWPRDDDGDDVRQAMHELADEIRGLGRKIGRDGGDSGGGAIGRHGITIATIVGLLSIVQYFVIDRFNERFDAAAALVTTQTSNLAAQISTVAQSVTNLAQSREPAFERLLAPLKTDVAQNEAAIRELQATRVSRDERLEMLRKLEATDVDLGKRIEDMGRDHLERFKTALQAIEARVQRVEETGGTLNTRVIQSINDDLDEVRRRVLAIERRFYPQQLMPENESPK